MLSLIHIFHLAAGCRAHRYLSWLALLLSFLAAFSLGLLLPSYHLKKWILQLAVCLLFPRLVVAASLSEESWLLIGSLRSLLFPRLVFAVDLLDGSWLLIGLLQLLLFLCVYLGIRCFCDCGHNSPWPWMLSTRQQLLFPSRFESLLVNLVWKSILLDHVDFPTECHSQVGEWTIL